MQPMLLTYADETIVPSAEDALRAGYLNGLGFTPFDALHVTCAERGAVDVLLTTDDGLLRRARRHRDSVTIRKPGILVSRGRKMNPVNTMSDEEFGRHALAILHRELGVDGLARFFRVYRAGTGDYTRDRHRWLDGSSIQEIMSEVERRSGPTG